jgi:dipeptidyl aminopeptidase/acylaminoacyl peptidase
MSRTIALLAITLIAGTPCNDALADDQPFSAEDLVRLVRASDPQLSPDGRKLAFTLRQTDMEANKGRTDLWVLDLDTTGARPRQLTQHEANDSSPRWSADGRRIYFLSTRSGSSQVWRLDLAGGEAMQVTRLPLDVGSMELSPRGDRLLASMEVFPDCKELACTKERLDARGKLHSKGMTFDRVFVRHWDTWKDGRVSQLFSVPLDPAGTAGMPVSLSGTLDADVPSKPFGDADDYTFSPDGKRVVFTARLKNAHEPWSTNFDLYEVPADGSAAPRNLTEKSPAWDALPAFSPDGRSLAWKAMQRPGYEADRFVLMVRDLASGNTREVTSAWDRSVGELEWARDGRRMIVNADHLGQHPLFAVDVRTGAVTQLVDSGNVDSFSVGTQRIVYGMASLAGPTDFYFTSATAAGGSTRLTSLNDERLSSRRMATFQQFTFSGWNGETVYAHVMKPVGFEADRKYPIAFIVHGGPQVSFGNAWSYRWNPQVYAGAGYAVLFIDFHGSPGYGQAFTDSINQDWGGKPFADLQNGLAAATGKFEWLDSDRVCALGASYGGFMTNWMAGKWPQRFDCLVTHAGIFDARSMYYSTEELWFEEWDHGGPQFKNPQNYEKFNPVNHVSAWRTPTLVIHGQLDYRVPYAQGISAFTALQRRGIPSRLLVYPDENHWVLKPHNSLQWHSEVLGWLGKHLKDEAKK